MNLLLEIIAVASLVSFVAVCTVVGLFIAALNGHDAVWYRPDKLKKK